MTPATLPLFGLLHDALLPGEERLLGAPALDTAHRKALAEAVGRRVALVTITSPVELPGLVAGRWATEVEVLRAEGEGLWLRGLGRLRLRRATRTEPPFEAEVERAPATADDTAAITSGVAALARALADGVPEGGPHRLRDAAAALLRAAVPAGELPALATRPLPEVLADVAAKVAARATAHAAEARIEAGVRTLSPREALDEAQKRRLWSAVVEIERALDVYDPGVGSDEGDLAKLEKRLKQAGLPKEAREVAQRELRTLRGMEARHPEYVTYREHLDLIARLPWHPAELPPIDLQRVQAVLDRTHEGLDRVKRRVLESLAVRALAGAGRAPILCLVGPPGTGKTTIARAMAEALGRPFVTVALGGVHDEAELRGHRPTFLAAGPGRIVDAFARCGSASPLVLLDEIDKLGTDRSRSPTGALLEILDPEQHHAFRDNFLGVPYDLSHAFFVCTANDAASIHPVLLDRLERIDIEGYAIEEKVRLARSHLLPRLVAETGLDATPGLDDDLLVALVEGHTREAGLRQLRRALEGICRARALGRLRDGADPGRPVTRDELDEVLGPGRVPRREREELLPPGTAWGLSIDGQGGALLPIEVLPLPGKGELHLTGQLGTVLQESARAARAHLRHAAERYGLSPSAFDADLHVHLPDGATPKDGPSAGVALAVAMTGALSARPVRPGTAFTGEVTLGGRVLPVGGVRAKVLAAERAGLARVVVPADNRNELPDGLRIEVVLVTTVAEAMNVAFAEGGAPAA